MLECIHDLQGKILHLLLIRFMKDSQIYLQDGLTFIHLQLHQLIKTQTIFLLCFLINLLLRIHTRSFHVL